MPYALAFWAIVREAVCARSDGAAAAFAEQWGFQSAETDWQKVIARDDIDLIDICSPNNTHLEIAIAAAQAPAHGGEVALKLDRVADPGNDAAHLLVGEQVGQVGVPNPQQQRTGH